MNLPEEPLKFGPERDDEIATMDEREELRRLSRRSIYIMAAILGYDKLNPRTHKAYCAFVESDRKRKLTLMPRGTLKTTLGTITDCCRRIAIDPNIRILLASSTGPNAKKMLKSIKSHFTGSAKFRWLFNEIIHDNFNSKGITWNEEAIQVPRTAAWPEPTISAYGVGAEVVSQHFDLFKFDDIIGLAAMDSEAIMEGATTWLTYSTSLAVSQHDLEMHLNGTRYGAKDTYDHAIKKMGFEVFARKAIVINPYTGEPEPFFPEMHSLEFLENIIRTDAFQWATQYANDPYDTVDSDFKPEWLQYYTIAPDGRIRYTDEDGSLGYQNIDDLTIYAHVDPGGEGKDSDENAIVIEGVNNKGLIFLLNTALFKGDALKLLDRVFELDKRFDPKLWSFEAVAYQRHLKFFAEDRMKREGRYLRIENHQPGNKKNKYTRIRRKLQPYFSTGRVYCLARQVEFISEYTHFSEREHPHLLDAFAQGPDYWKTPLSDKARERISRAIKNQTDNRGVTGYGL